MFIIFSPFIFLPKFELWNPNFGHVYWNWLCFICSLMLIHCFSYLDYWIIYYWQFLGWNSTLRRKSARLLGWVVDCWCLRTFVSIVDSPRVIPHVRSKPESVTHLRPCFWNLKLCFWKTRVLNESWKLRGVKWGFDLNNTSGRLLSRVTRLVSQVTGFTAPKKPDCYDCTDSICSRVSRDLRMPEC